MCCHQNTFDESLCCPGAKPASSFPKRSATIEIGYPLWAAVHATKAGTLCFHAIVCLHRLRLNDPPVQLCCRLPRCWPLQPHSAAALWNLGTMIMVAGGGIITTNNQLSDPDAASA
jgi:hypothetical protein